LKPATPPLRNFTRPFGSLTGIATTQGNARLKISRLGGCREHDARRRNKIAEIVRAEPKNVGAEKDGQGALHDSLAELEEIAICAESYLPHAPFAAALRAAGLVEQIAQMVADGCWLQHGGDGWAFPRGSKTGEQIGREAAEGLRETLPGILYQAALLATAQATYAPPRTLARALLEILFADQVAAAPPDPPTKGPQARCTPRAVIEALAKLGADASLKQTAAEIGVTRQTLTKAYKLAGFNSWKAVQKWWRESTKYLPRRERM
jgi:hypothetical protein